MRFRDNEKVWADKTAKWKAYNKSLQVSYVSKTKNKKKTKTKEITKNER